MELDNASGVLGPLARGQTGVVLESSVLNDDDVQCHRDCPLIGEETDDDDDNAGDDDHCHGGSILNDDYDGDDDGNGNEDDNADSYDGGNAVNGNNAAHESSGSLFSALFNHLLPHSSTPPPPPPARASSGDSPSILTLTLPGESLLSLEKTFAALMLEKQAEFEAMLRRSPDDVAFKEDLEEGEKALRNVQIEDCNVGNEDQAERRSVSDSQQPEADSRSYSPCSFFNLPIVFSPGHTGFQSTSDYIPPLGTLACGRYLFVGVLGEAAFSRAYRATDIANGGDVCLKVIKGGNKDFFDQGLDEARILKVLGGKSGTVELKEFFYWRECLVLVTE